jgi:hypothetical protein
MIKILKDKRDMMCEVSFPSSHLHNCCTCTFGENKLKKRREEDEKDIQRTHHYLLPQQPSMK